MFRGRSKTRLRLRQFARLYPETSTPFRWLCTGSPKPTPTQKQGKVVRPRCNDLRFSSRLPMPEPDVRRPKQTAQLSEPQASFERSGRGAAGGGDPPSSAKAQRATAGYGRHRHRAPWGSRGTGVSGPPGRRPGASPRVDGREDAGWRIIYHGSPKFTAEPFSNRAESLV